MTAMAADYNEGVLKIAPANGHARLVDAQEHEPAVLARASDAAPSIGNLDFSPSERRSLELLGDDLREVLDAAISTATALAGRSPDAARLDEIAKAIACERARQLQLSRLLDEQTFARRRKNMVAIDRLLNSSNRRLCALVAEHRASCSTGHRAAVVVGHANNVRVQAGK